MAIVQMATVHRTAPKSEQLRCLEHHLTTIPSGVDTDQLTSVCGVGRGASPYGHHKL